MTKVSANASTTRIAADCDSDDGSLTDCSNVGASAAAGIVETSGSMELCLCIVPNTRYRKMRLVVTLAKNDRDSMRSVVHGSNCFTHTNVVLLGHHFSRRVAPVESGEPFLLEVRPVCTGLRAYWRWKSRGRAGRPRVSRELRELIQRMSKENPLWGAPRVHGELLKLGFEIAESTISKYMIRRRGPPSQTWRTFLCNHAAAIAAIDLCVVPTLTFECLFAFLVLGHDRRQPLWFAVTRHPTAEWLAQQLVEALPWGMAPTYLVRDNDCAYGQAFTNRVRAMGIRADRQRERAFTTRTP
jgi:hypothetical protein